jgi:dihydrofolate synthase/folylpolyglutamate synthase
MNSAGTQKESYNDAIAYLYGLQKFGIKLGLDNTRSLMSLLDGPQSFFKSVHVAGTNGKGSVSAMIASILRTAGCRVGLFTSPHLVSFTERIRVDNVEISEQEVVELTSELKEIVEENKDRYQPEFSPTFFEFVTAAGFLYFKRKGVEWAVVETGMGGRLDATNVLTPEVSVITGIGHDHKEFLGRTLKEIAGEKAGIIKEGVPVVSSSQEPDAMKVITEKAAEKKTPLFVYGEDFSSRVKDSDMNGVVFDYEGEARLKDIKVPLCGMHQMENASVAIKAVELIMRKETVAYDHVREGLSGIKWPGRMELIKDSGHGYDILIDGAHNPSASAALARSLKEYFLASYQTVILVIGIMSDKDMIGIMKPLLPLASEIIFTAPDYERAALPERLQEYAAAMGFGSKVAHSVKEALELAETSARASSRRTVAVIAGSFYTIGEAKLLLGHKGVLARLRE